MKVIVINGTEYKLRESLLTSDWDIYSRAENIMGDIRKKKLEVNTDIKEIEINAGDFTKDQFTEFASMGFIGADNRRMTKEECAQLPLDDAMKGFANFFFIYLKLAIYWNASRTLN